MRYYAINLRRERCTKCGDDPDPEVQRLCLLTRRYNKGQHPEHPTELYGDEFYWVPRNARYFALYGAIKQATTQFKALTNRRWRDGVTACRSGL